MKIMWLKHFLQQSWWKREAKYNLPYSLKHSRPLLPLPIDHSPHPGTPKGSKSFFEFSSISFISYLIILRLPGKWKWGGEERGPLILSPGEVISIDRRELVCWSVFPSDGAYKHDGC
jgi:hypothetical protein